MKSFVPLLLAASTVGACAKKADPVDAGAPAGSATAAGSMAAPSPGKKSLDATACNPGTSLNPPDRGKSFRSDQFEYTLLDARTDDITTPGAPYKKVLLVKLAVENLTRKSDVNLSVAEVDSTRDKAGPDRVQQRALFLKNDLFYDRAKMCVDLGADVQAGSFPPGTKVVGYYVYGLTDPPPASLWFDARNVSPESVSRGDLLKVVGTFHLK